MSSDVIILLHHGLLAAVLNLATSGDTALQTLPIQSSSAQLIHDSMPV